MAVVIKSRRDIQSNWSTKNPILSLGEIGIETDTRKFKFGDGATPWNSLSYLSGGAGIISDTGIAGGGSVVNNIVTISVADYSGLGSYNPTTIYFVTGT